MQDIISFTKLNLSLIVFGYKAYKIRIKKI